jgi:hypothetical protein
MSEETDKLYARVAAQEREQGRWRMSRSTRATEEQR